MATSKISKSANGYLYNVITSGSLYDFATSASEGLTCFRYNNSVTDTPSEYGHGILVKYGQNLRFMIFDMVQIKVYTAFKKTQSWSAWKEFSIGGGT